MKPKCCNLFNFTTLLLLSMSLFTCQNSKRPERDASLPPSQNPPAGEPPGQLGNQCGAFSERVKTFKVPLDAPLAVSDQNAVLYRFNIAEAVKPISLSFAPNGEIAVSWHSKSQSIYYTRLSSALTKIGQDASFQATRVLDVAARDDGAGLLLWDGKRMNLARVDKSGKELWRSQLASNRVDAMHVGKVLFDGTKYVAYFGVHDGGHEGDALVHWSDSNAKVPGGWDWGCSHSLDMRLLQTSSKVIPVCLSDCFPKKGVVFNNNRVLAQTGGNCLGTVQASLGGVAPINDKIAVAYMKRDGNNYEARWLTFDPSSGAVAGDTALWSDGWLNPKIARYDNDKVLLVSTKSGSARIQELGATSNLTPYEIPATLGPIDEIETAPDGAVVWAYGVDGASELNIVRVAPCKK
jgi:hypothetical protein